MRKVLLAKSAGFCFGVRRAVKLADLAHNADESRLAGCEGEPEAQRARRREKYARARAILENPCPDAPK